MAVNFQNMNEEMSALVDIRTMNSFDLKQVIVVEEKAYPHPWTLGIFRDCLRVGYNSWVMTLDQQVIAYAIVMLSPGEAHILNICVDPEYQAKGLGRHLLRHLIKKINQTDIDMVLLEVRRSNANAQLLYQSEGFHELGVRKAYYPAKEGREDAIILAKYLAHQ
ncbi:Ribosomal-protein-S18p-alanine acetyltransferase [hydrothermal vent metagenome]|uniref:Ribosomal-protein-S18p-alanine acetyltransferase n=1 Tax=hydrothermal vent metagenome TaxID=652676 RepID=A0A3B0WUT2_9ZZZZ